MAWLAATIATINLAAPSIGVLAWALLLGSMGWNFLADGFNTFEGAVPGWIICGVMFGLMALPPARPARTSLREAGPEHRRVRARELRQVVDIYAALGVIAMAPASGPSIRGADPAR